MKKLLLIGTVMMLASCATVTTKSIESSLRDLGLDAKRADCVGGELTDRLDNDDLLDLAKFMRGLSRADSPNAAFQQLRKTDNPRALLAITAAGASCLF